MKKKKWKNYNACVRFSQILRKNVTTYAENLGHLTSSNIFFLNKLLYTLFRSAWRYYVFLFLHMYSPRKSPHNHWMITPQPLDHNPTMMRSAIACREQLTVYRQTESIIEEIRRWLFFLNSTVIKSEKKSSSALYCRL